MCQYGVGMASFDKFERGPPVVAGDGLVPEPHDCPVGIPRQLLRRGKDAHDGLKALLDQGGLWALRKCVAMHMSQLGEIR